MNVTKYVWIFTFVLLGSFQIIKSGECPRLELACSKTTLKWDRKGRSGNPQWTGQTYRTKKSNGRGIKKLSCKLDGHKAAIAHGKEVCNSKGLKNGWIAPRQD